MSRCRAIRTAMNLTQPQLAEKLGVSQAHVSRMETGQPYSRSLDLLLDRIAIDAGLLHLTSAAAAISSSAAPDASAALPDPPSGEAA